MSGPRGGSGADEALMTLAHRLREEGTLLSPRVVEPVERPALGELVAAGPRAEADPAAYALLFETIREGALAHYGPTARVLDLSGDGDLALLAGDYLYARGLERLAELGDLDAVRELADLIGLLAAGLASEAVDAAWLASAIAVGCGGSPGLEDAKERARAGDPEAAVILSRAAAKVAGQSGLSGALSDTAKSLGFDSLQVPLS